MWPKSGYLTSSRTGFLIISHRFGWDQIRSHFVIFDAVSTQARHRCSCVGPMESEVYQLFRHAMADRKTIICTYDGYRRQLCPIILGHSGAEEKALTYQFAGQSRSGLPPSGQWRCLWLSKVRDVELRAGPWHSGSSHNQPQGCVDIVDLDVNPASPYNPKRRL